MFGRSAWHRVYSDYLMPCRIDEYRDLLKKIMQHGYRTHSIVSFWRLLTGGEDVTGGRHAVLRHDVDVDPTAAEEIWHVEQELGARSSFYFRLSTLDLDLMGRIEQSGSEASYHYEEIATVVKQHRLRTREQVFCFMPEIQQLFRENYVALKDKSHLPMASVAAHGDFANRAIEMANWHLLRLPDLRSELGIEVEAYDRQLMDPVTSRISDAQYPELWRPIGPDDAIRDLSPVIYILTHPRRWKPGISARARHDIIRLIEGIGYHSHMR